MKILFQTIILFVHIFWLWACEKEAYPDFYSGMGKRPVYVPISDLGQVKNLPVQPIVNSGVIFLRDTLLFMLEDRKGIHVFNIKDSTNIGAVAFFGIPAVTAFTLTGNRLYADSWRDLLTIDISNIYEIKLVNRQTDVFSPLLFPPFYEGIFECVDESKGAVVGWEDAELENARCRTF